MDIKFKELLVLFSLVFFISCGSNKNVADKSSKKNKRETNNTTSTGTVTQEESESTASSSNGGSNNNSQGNSYSNNNSQGNNTQGNNSNGTLIEKQSEYVSKTYSLTSNYTEEYIEEFAPIAVIEMHKYKIPASITLAQGILESGSGRSPLALKSNNHFGIKCHKGWKGTSVSHDDDALGECFRSYKHPDTSYEDHSIFLTTRNRYSRLFKLRLTDYVGWAYGLKKAGYATDKKYPKKLITIIKKHHLYRYDSAEAEYTTQDTQQYTSTSQQYSAHTVSKGDTLYNISKRYNITVEKLKSLNGLRNNTIVIGQELIVN